MGDVVQIVLFRQHGVQNGASGLISKRENV